MNERKELIERLSEYASTSLAPALMRQAADMLEADAQRLSNLLARIHRDGGHYEVEHGTDKAVADADLKVAQAYADLFELQQTATSDEWLANCPQSVRDLANKIKAEMAVPQEPVAWYEYNADLDAWFLAYGHNPKAKTRPLVFGDAAPQQRPRLTDAEIKAIEHETDMKSSIGDWSNYFARAIEAKVRGEA